MRASAVNNSSKAIRKTASQKELVWVGRFMVLAVAVLAICLASNPDSKVLGLVAYAWAGFGAAFGPLIILSLFWKRLIETKRFKSGVAGFLRTTEVTRGNDGDMMAHPHFHALLLVKPSYFKGQGYIKQGDWVEMWSKALRADYLPSVNVKAVKATLDEKGRKQLDKAICETLKYSVKPSDLALERDKGAWLHEMTKQVHKMRFIATGGVLKGILKPEDEITTEEMISSSEEVQDVGEARVAFQFRPEYRKYVYAPKYNEYAD
jgi:hypothetical protein